ncbi:MAG: hypothetical protein KME38_29405 [Spirirestis rafaelensis WJT71-NPBG6]|jgi:hypothetical protein|nr:hypothetical protein [Spirirestis rafaelensis WJT71-NPBG6]
MKTSINGASNALSIVASVLFLGSVISFVNAKEADKPLILNIACTSGALGIGSKISSLFCSHEADYNIDKQAQNHELVVKRLEQDNTTLSKQFTKQTIALNEALKLTNKYEQTILDKQSQLDTKERLIASLTNDLSKLKSSVTAKLNEDDTRYETVCKQLKTVFQESLKSKIDYVYERLADMSANKLNDENFERIHPTLRLFYENLAHYRYQHYQLINEIPHLNNENIAEDLSNIFLQITDELSSHKVKYRNTLNIDERDSLALAMQELIERRDTKKFIPKPKVDVALDMQRNVAKEDLEKIKVHAFQSKESLRELRDEFQNFIGQLEVKNEEIASLNQQIFELKKPQQFYGGGSISRAGNDISIHYYKRGYKLDCLTWEETITGYTITFGIRHNPAITEDELYADKGKEHLTAYTDAIHPTVPTIDINRQDCTLKLIVQQRVIPKKVVTPQEQVTEIRTQLSSPNSLLTFVEESYHIGLWGETGQGKTTAIANIIGGMHQTMVNPKMRVTIPKIDSDSAKMFPDNSANWVGVTEAIFGLLEAALEIQYRIWINEQSYKSGKEVLDFEPILFFIDEINLIFQEWGSIAADHLARTLEEFKSRLSGERKEFFTDHMQPTLESYKGSFAKRLLKFIWQTGRSLRVKSLIAGQNLQPGAFGFHANDLANCAYIALGDSKRKCSEFKVKSMDSEAINEQLNSLDVAIKTDNQLKFTGLFCPSVGSSYLALLPMPSTYDWKRPNNTNRLDKKNILSKPENIASKDWTRLDNFGQQTSDISDISDTLDISDSLYTTVDTMQDNTFQAFSQMSKLSKQYQNMGKMQLVQLFNVLPKKADGSVHKTQAYERVFKVSRSEDRKVYSEFIDYLEAICKQL